MAEANQPQESSKKEMSLKTGTPLDMISSATGLTIPQMTRYAMYAGVICVMLGIGGTYITVALGVAYPVFMTFLALESEGGDDDKQWLTYWIVFGAFNILDHFADVITAFIPFYLLFKVIFFVYLMHPWTQGATTVYNMLILPNVKKYDT